jgi:hypothetical protein
MLIEREELAGALDGKAPGAGADVDVPPPPQAASTKLAADNVTNTCLRIMAPTLREDDERRLNFAVMRVTF